MQITDVRIRKVEGRGSWKAVASITIDGVFVVHDLKIIKGERGLFVGMPSRKSNDGIYHDIAHPIDMDTRNDLQNLVLQKYEEYLVELEAAENAEEIVQE